MIYSTSFYSNYSVKTLDSQFLQNPRKFSNNVVSSVTMILPNIPWLNEFPLICSRQMGLRRIIRKLNSRLCQWYGHNSHKRQKKLSENQSGDFYFYLPTIWKYALKHTEILCLQIFTKIILWRISDITLKTFYSFLNDLKLLFLQFFQVFVILQNNCWLYK